MPNIKSSTDLRNSYNAISTFCHEHHEPVFITRNGQGDLAVMSIELYEEMSKKNNTQNIYSEESREELHRLLLEGRTDVLTGNTILHQDVIAGIKRRISDGRI